MRTRVCVAARIRPTAADQSEFKVFKLLLPHQILTYRIYVAVLALKQVPYHEIMTLTGILYTHLYFKFWEMRKYQNINLEGSFSTV